LELKQALLDNAQRLATIHRTAFKAAMPHLPDLHTIQEDLGFYQTVVLVECDTWVMADDQGIQGFMALKPEWVEHLYIDVKHQGQGLGTQLVNHAKRLHPELRLYTFQRNATALAFYKSLDFKIIEMTDGAGNEEKEPDVLLEWTGDTEA
jgi:putative acetyltransferase